MRDKKIKKRNQNTYKRKKHLCLFYEKKTDNKDIKGVALENQIGQQISTCVDCGSRKSTFLKPIKPIRNKKQFLQITKHANLL